MPQNSETKPIQPSTPNSVFSPRNLWLQAAINVATSDEFFYGQIPHFGQLREIFIEKYNFPDTYEVKSMIKFLAEQMNKFGHQIEKFDSKNFMMLYQNLKQIVVEQEQSTVEYYDLCFRFSQETYFSTANNFYLEFMNEENDKEIIQAEKTRFSVSLLDEELTKKFKHSLIVRNRAESVVFLPASV